jgi:hypothetical protein
MYSRNMEKLLLHIYKANALDLAEEITKGMMVTRDGAVVHERVADAVKKAKPLSLVPADAVNQ